MHCPKIEPPLKLLPLKVPHVAMYASCIAKPHSHGLHTRAWDKTGTTAWGGLHAGQAALYSGQAATNHPAEGGCAALLRSVVGWSG
jgi:hypothetical protein